MNTSNYDINFAKIEDVKLTSDVLLYSEFNEAVRALDNRLSDVTINEEADLPECVRVLKTIISRFGGNNYEV